MRAFIAIALVYTACAPPPSDPCGTMTLRECGMASHTETDATRRAQLAAAACERGDPEGCSSLGLQLLLGSASEPARRRAAYRAFQMSCSTSVTFLCLQPMFAELHSDNPNADFVVNGFHADCTAHPYEWCHLIPAIKDRLHLPVTESELATARDYDERMPYFDIEEVLSPEFHWAQRARILADMSPDTHGDLWAVGGE